jgi:para-aminobenzoate synthetase / 4-amino-4-deoxychorismate lyase
VPELASEPRRRDPSSPRPDPQQGVFETLLVLDGHPVERDAHLARLHRSLAALFPGRTAPDPPVPDVPSLGKIGAMRVTVSPDAHDRLEARVSVRDVPPERIVDPPPVALRSLTVAGGLGPHKWADRTLLDEAQGDLPVDALLLVVDADRTVLEASRANIFAVRGGALFTPPLDGRILPGITRARVLKLAAAADIEAREAELGRGDLLAADEVFLTGSVRGVERVEALDGAPLAARGEIGSRIATELRRVWSSG